MRQYETTFVIDSQLKSGEIDEIIKKFERFISVNGGQILEVQRWGKRRLAYEIKKRQYGYYVHIRFAAGKGSIIRALEREYQLNEAILRYLTVVLEKQALKAEALKKEKMGKVPAEAPVPEETPEEEEVTEEFDKVVDSGPDAGEDQFSETPFSEESS